MKTVPPPLQPWTTELGMLKAQGWPLLGQLLPRLDGALFRSRVGESRSRAVPDGFDGVTYQGSLNRLLSTEWGLLNQRPYEFYRRLAMGESQYLKWGYLQPAKPKAFYALLDRGPDQYGAPFLVQLALLLVLARRAREQDLLLNVGFLQAPGKWAVFTPRTLETQIHPYVTHARLLPSMLSAWKEEFDVEAHQQALWVVASPREPVPFGQWLCVESDMRTGAGAADAQATTDQPPVDQFLTGVFKPSQQTFQFHVRNPKTALSVLRRPFVQVTRPVPTVREAGPGRLPAMVRRSPRRWQIHPSSRVCFLLSDRTLAAVKVPKRVVPANRTLKQYTYKLDRALVGIWQAKSTLCTVEADPSALYFTGFCGERELVVALEKLPADFDVPTLENLTAKDKATLSTPLPLAYMRRTGDRLVLLIADASDRYVLLTFVRRLDIGLLEFKSAKTIGILTDVCCFHSSLFYTDGSKTMWEFNPAYTAPKRTEHPNSIEQLMPVRACLNNRYVAVLPAMRDDQGNWTRTLTDNYGIAPSDRIVGGGYHGLIVQRNEEIWQLQRRWRKGEAFSHSCLMTIDDSVADVRYHPQHDWLTYQLNSELRIYDIALKTEIATVELA